MKRFIKASLFLMMICMLSGCKKTENENEHLEIYAYLEGESVYSLENDNLLFELDPSTTYFTVTDKSNGNQWHSNPVDLEEDMIAIGDYKNQLKSTMIIEFTSPLGISRLFNNYDYSISRGIYEIVQGEDTVEVKYSIGNVQKEFILPPAVPESRMNLFLDNMEDYGKKQIQEYYRKYDINNLRSTDNRSELLKTYPDLENECVYVLRSGLQDYLKARIETIFEEAGYTIEDFDEDLERYSLDGGSNNQVYNISVVYSLEGNDLVVDLPFDKMEWQDDYPLTKIKVLPFFGAGGMEDTGFVLVPEGTGGIIEFNNGKKIQNAYYADVYGWDYAMKRNALIDESRTQYPVFGISNNESSMLCILEDFVSLAAIEADVSGRSNSYNYANATYRIVHGDMVEVTTKTDQTVILYEANEFEGEIKQRYCFLDTTGYDGMAKKYQEYLLGKYDTLAKKEEESVPVNISFVGAIDKVKQRFGIPMRLDIPLTTYSDASVLLEDLLARGFQNMNVVYTGWMNGGITHSVLTKVKTISELGSKNKLKEFVSLANSKGIPVYFEGNVQFAYDNGLFDGYKVNQDSSKHTTREITEMYDFSNVAFIQAQWSNSYFLVKPQVMREYAMNLLESADSLGGIGVALRSVGYKLGADYNPKNRITREGVMKRQQELLSEIKNAGNGTITYGGNDYVLEYSDYILDMDLKGNPYNIIDYSVPFYQMAIHGLVNYFGTSVNLANDYTEMILRSAECGAGLSFTFIKESTTELQESYYYTYLYGSEYSKWIELATELYTRYNSEMSGCFDQYMTGHKRISDGVYATTYEDGTKVYVNYNYEDYTGQIHVPARDYVVEKGAR